MKVELIKHPSAEDWILCKQCALVTIGKKVKTEPDIEWKRSILEARHSPIRELKFVFFIEGIPSWVATHLARHVHAQPYIRSQRNDRQADYDRRKAPQDTPVDMIWSANAEEFIIVNNKRLCKLAAKETQEVVRLMSKLALEACPEFKDQLVPMCVYHGGVCHEMFPCRKE